MLGGHYVNHHPDGPKTTVTVGSGGKAHAIMKGISVDRLIGTGSLYKVSPLEKGTTPLLTGTIPGQPPEPIAWTHAYGPKHARVFFTSFLGIQTISRTGGSAGSSRTGLPGRCGK